MPTADGRRALHDSSDDLTDPGVLQTGGPRTLHAQTSRDDLTAPAPTAPAPPIHTAGEVWDPSSPGQVFQLQESTDLTPFQLVRMLALSPFAILRFWLYVVVLIFYVIFERIFYTLKRNAFSPGCTVFTALAKFGLDSSHVYLAEVWTGAFFGQAMLWSMGVKYRSRYPENYWAARKAAIDGTPFQVIANHQSYLDMFALFGGIGPFCPVTRQDIVTIPVMGTVVLDWESLLINRANKGGGAARMMAARGAATGSGATRTPLMVHPEGTCSNGRCLLEFKRGAFVGGNAILPICIRYSTGSGRCLSSVAPYTDLRWLIQMLTEWNKEVEVTYLPLYVPSEIERADPKVFAEGVQRTMARSLGVPVTKTQNADTAQKYYQESLPSYVHEGEREEQVERIRRPGNQTR